MRAPIVLLPVLINLLLVSPAFAEKDLMFEIIDSRKDLPWNEVRRIHEDREGYLWFSTYLGLVRYDGYEFKTYRNTLNSSKILTSNFINAVSDDDRRIWIGTDNGLNYINKSDWKFGSINKPAIKNASINKIITLDDTLWVGTNKGLMIYYTDSNGKERVEQKLFRDSSRFSAVEDLFLDSRKRLWIGSKNQGLSRYDQNTGKFIQYTTGPCQDFAHKIYEDAEGNLWIGTWGEGLVRIENISTPQQAVYTFFRHDGKDPFSIGSDIIYSICQDRLSGDIWIGHRGGLSIIRSNTYGSPVFENYRADRKDHHLSDNDISDIYQTRDGSIWLATIGGGINVHNPANAGIGYLDIRKISERFNSGYVTSMCKVSENTLWIGLKNEGIVILDLESGRFKHHTEIPALRKLASNIKVTRMIVADHGNKIFCSAEGKGVFLVSIDHGEPVECLLSRAGDPNSILEYDYAFALMEDSQGRLWVSSGKKLTLTDYTLHAICSYNLPPEYTSISTGCVEDQEGNVWLSSKKSGVLRLKREGESPEFTVYNTGNKRINNDQISDLFLDQKGQLWVGTMGGGLNIYDASSDSFKCMNTEYNLRYPDIFEIFEDNLGNLWACTRDAFIRIGLYDDSGYEIFNSGIFPWDNAFYNGSQHCALDRDTFAVSGMNGISTLTPGKVVSEMTSGKIVFSDISVGYNSIFDYGLPKNCVYKDNSLDLNKKNNGFSVKFASLEFSNSSLIRYSYRLKGYDKDWITCSLDTREANYTNLPKGRYTFEVRASNSSGKWRDTITTLSVRIRPGIFEAWYSYVLYVITFAGILYSVKRISSNRMRIKNQLQISEMEKEKNEELTRSKLRFFTNISHEFLTPLSIIGCSVENIHPMDQGSGNNIKIVQNNVQKLRNLIREILDFSKSESGKLELKVANGNIAELLRAICLNDFSVLSKEKNIVLEYDIPEVVQGWYDADKIDKIVSNLVSNALKYNFENSYVRVSLMEDFDEDKRYAVISVKDGGVGIPFDKIGKIFDHFYEGDFRETKKEGIGIGLALTKSLVELHKGSIDVHSILGVGTDFTVRIPINEKAYSDNERKTDTVWSVEDMECRFAETGKRILIVEDNKELRYLMSQYLAKYYVIEEASDGIEALKKLEDSYFDLIITDVMMPNMDGKELCRRIKGNAEYSEIPVLLLTAKSSEQDKIEGYDSGADAFMTKPFQMPLLVSRITNLLKSREQIKQNYIKEDNGIKITALSYTSLDEKFLQNAADLVLANISNEDFHMDDFISDMNVSKSTLYRKLKTLTGMSCSEFVKDMRLKEAARIIREKNVNVSEISYLVGFGQPKYFTYCFKKKFGVSPSEYMRQNQQQSL